jgi:hypothetical protein
MIFPGGNINFLRININYQSTEKRVMPSRYNLFQSRSITGKIKLQKTLGIKFDDTQERPVWSLADQRRQSSFT